jgi:hypothetical protein
MKMFEEYNGFAGVPRKEGAWLCNFFIYRGVEK